MTNKATVEGFKYKELSVDEVEGVLNQEVEKLCNAVQLPPSIARLLLSNNEWNVERIKSKFASNPLALLASQGLLPPPTSFYATASDSPAVMNALEAARIAGHSVKCYTNPPKLNTADDVCSICFDRPSPSSSRVEFFPQFPVFGSGTSSIQLRPPLPQSPLLYGLSCGHRFCAGCWSDYLCTQISEGFSMEIRCMAVSCNVLVPEDFLLSLLKGSPLRDKYLTFIFHRMVMSHPSLRFCVGADCSVVICALEPPKARRVFCSRCDTSFCFVCGEPYHAPTSCDIMKRWIVKCHDDSGTATYMAAHTKDCPECHVCIEKNGGCNHMQCTHCNHEFCWVCLEDWSTHSGHYYTCSRYTEVSDPAKDQARQQARECLRRYVFYYDRWTNHERSLQLEQEHRVAVTKRIHEKVLNKEGTWIDWQYLLTAADTLRDCRYTLKYTYPMAFFSEHLKNRELFEYQQALLESEVEDLAWKVERAKITDRAALQNAMDLCEKHRLTLLHEFLKD
ncbi:unnamed protein product [Dicrocoelium dendriticum]|nr:unnamed protein product [Dicrocoelium dendriticum]